MQLEELLIEKCRKNDGSAQKELYQRYSQAMFNICTRMLPDSGQAHDVLQEAFITVFTQINQFKGKSFAAWIKRIVINKCINEIKRSQKIVWEKIDAYDVQEEKEEPLNVDFSTINACIKDLPQGCRMVFVLKVMEGYDHQEIADQLSISVSTSKSQLARAKQLLRVSLLKSMVA